MNGRRLTDAQISTRCEPTCPTAPARAARANPRCGQDHRAAASAAVAFGAISDADPVVRRRSLLIAAALLVALALASVAAVGSFRLLQRDPVRDLSLEPRPSLQGFVAPSSTPSRPSDGPTSSAFPRPTGVWIATGPMGTPRYGFTAVRLVDGRVLVVGGAAGADGGNDLLRGVVRPGLRDLDRHRKHGQPRGDCAMATLLRDGKVLVAGGNSAEVYDPASGTWTATGKIGDIGAGLPRPRCCATARCSWSRRRRRAVRPRQRDLDRHGEDDTHRGTSTRRRCCPTAGCL